MRDDAPCSQIPAEAARHPRRCARWCDDHRGLARNAAPELGMTPAVSSQRWRRRLLSASLTLLAFLAFGAGVAIFVWRLTSLQPPPAVGHSSFKKAGDSRAIPTDFYRSPDPTVLMSVESVNLQAGTMTLGLSLMIPSSILESVTGRDGQSIVEQLLPLTEMLKPQYSSARWLVYIGPRSPSAAYPFARSFSARIEDTVSATGAAYRYSGPVVPLSPPTLTIPMQGSSDEYPEDRYATGLYAMTLAPTVGPQISEDLILPKSTKIQTLVYSTPSLGNLRVLFGGPKGWVMIQVSRSTLLRWFVWIVLAAPLVLALGIAGVVCCSKSIGSSEIRDLLLGLIAATISLLTIRTVLVPADVDTSCFVDWCLSAEVLLFVAIALFGLKRAIPPRPSP